MSTVAHFSLDHFEHMVEVGAFSGPYQKRLELIRGEIIEMTPIGTGHSNCVTLLTDWSYEVAPRERIMIRSQNPVRLPINDTEPQPDVVWVTRKDYSKIHPGPKDILLIIEVADSSLEFDRGEKLGIYAEAGILDYWIVNLIDEQIEVYRNPVGRKYQDSSDYRGDAEISPVSDLKAIFQPSHLFG
jgi:Uma2 family endonuclease